MPGWFDTYAKRSARATAKPALGVSRRRVITGGSAAVGAAWAAPMLTSAPAYAFGASSCAAANRCGAANELQACCAGPVGSNIGDYGCVKVGGVNTCVSPGNVGGTCPNGGVGGGGCFNSARCNGSTTACNCGAAGTAMPTYASNICGGYGASCAGNGDCSPGFVCYGGAKSFCAPDCSSTPCTSGTCLGGVCKQTCTKSQDCPANSDCSGTPKYCTGN